MKYSFLYCVYNNAEQFENSIWTAMHQDYSYEYEIIVTDNATPGDAIKKICDGNFRIRYSKISEQDKHCYNITQGMNLGAWYAKGEYIVIIADSNVLLSFNLLDKIDEVIDPDTLVLSSGPTNDLKIVPPNIFHTGDAHVTAERATLVNKGILKDMGWPNDPLKLRLPEHRYFYPPPHILRDCYIAAMQRDAFIAVGGYDESQTRWGPYHQFFLDSMATKFKKEVHLRGIRIIHQYHKLNRGETIAN